MRKKETSQKPATTSPDKATNRIGVKLSDRVKEQLQANLDKDPNYGGNLSDFFNDCIRSYNFQQHRGERLRYPIEFVREP